MGEYLDVIIAKISNNQFDEQMESYIEQKKQCQDMVQNQLMANPQMTTANIPLDIQNGLKQFIPIVVPIPPP
jgi:DNA repair protein RadC